MSSQGFLMTSVYVAILTIYTDVRLSSCCSEKTGIRLRVTDSGLRYAKDVYVSLLVNQLQGSRLRDQSGSSGVDYWLSNMRVTQLSVPQSSFQTSQGVGLTLQAWNMVASIHGNWKYKTRGWFSISDRGSFDLKGRGLQFTVSVRFGEQNGRPTISFDRCTAYAGNFYVKFHGGASWFYNLFRRIIADSLKGSFQDMVCKNVRRSIDVKAARELASFNTALYLGRGIQIKYDLTRSPLITSSYLDIFMKGQFQSSYDTQDTPFCPRFRFPHSTKSRKMLYIWLSDYVLNRAARVYHKEGLIGETIKTIKGKNGRREKLTTKTLQYLVYQLQKRFPNRPAEVKLYTSEPPVFTLKSSGLGMTLVGSGEIFVKLANGSLFHAFTLRVFVNVSLSLGSSNGKLTGRVNKIMMKLSVKESFMGDIKTNIRFFNGFFLPMFTKRITDKINKYGAIGIPFPAVKYIKFLRTELSTGDRFISVGTDVMYTAG